MRATTKIPSKMNGAYINQSKGFSPSANAGSAIMADSPAQAEACLISGTSPAFDLEEAKQMPEASLATSAEARAVAPTRLTETTALPAA
mmetsp:Transcript_97003/g.172658  ORF Transcript_97003/g.172658 Transcript_97003/m.172658 type:complete len:89 (-) Transcript_97003:59-325(-)